MVDPCKRWVAHIDAHEACHTHLQHGLPSDKAKSKFSVSGMANDNALSEGLGGLVGGIDRSTHLLCCAVNVLDEGDLFDDPLANGKEHLADPR